MNKLLFGWNIVLTILVAILLYRVKSGNSTNKNEIEIANMPPIALDSMAQGGIVYINTDSLMEQYLLVKDFKAELEKEKNTKESAFQNKMNALAQQVNNFKEIAQRLSPEEAERQQTELMQKEQKLNEYREELMQELVKKEQDKTIMMQQNIQSYIKNLNQNGKYTFVLGYSQAGGILYANKNLDITNQVVLGLNQLYKNK